MSMKEFDLLRFTPFFWCEHSEKFGKVSFLMGNNFLNNNSKDIFLSKFSRFQRTINAFKKLAKMWRIKRKYVVYQNTTDFKGVELSEYRKELVIELIENNTVYSFLIHDLLKIWCVALRQRIHAFENPLKFKNPYTNMPFSITNLYNIYYRAFFNLIKRHPLVDMHFNSKFSLQLLLRTYGSQMREWAIYDYANTDDISLYYELIGIQEEYGHILRCLRTDERFSNNVKLKQIKQYRQLIKTYCFISYSNNNHLISHFTKIFYALINLHNEHTNRSSA